MEISWEDPRIIKIGSSSNRKILPGERIPLDLRLTKLLWSPDLDIYGLKKAINFEVLRKDVAGTMKKYFVSQIIFT